MCKKKKMTLKHHWKIYPLSGLPGVTVKESVQEICTLHQLLDGRMPVWSVFIVCLFLHVHMNRDFFFFMCWYVNFS